MADDPGRIDLETIILLLPSVSRAAHLDAPLLHAQHLIELWKIDSPADDVAPLTQAFRLLNDAEAVAGAILRAAAAENFPGGADYWGVPSAQALLPELRELVWRGLLAGTLITEAIKGVRGSRHRTVLPAELLRLTPDWRLSRFTLDGRDAFINARIRHVSAEPVKKTWREPFTEEVLRAAAKAIEQTYPPGAHPSFDEFWAKLRVHRTTRGATRDDAYMALGFVPRLRGRRGYRSTKSPK